MISVLARRRPRPEHDDGLERLAPGRVGDAEDGALEHGRVAVEARLDLGRVDVLAAADHHVLGAVDDVDEAVLVPRRHVAGPHPAAAVAEDLGGEVGPAPVADHVRRALDDDLADGRAVARRRDAGLVDDPQAREVHLEPAARRAMGADPGADLAVHPGRQGAHRASLRLAVALHQVAREALHDLPDDALRPSARRRT